MSAPFLEADGWRRAGLHEDDEAVAWTRSASTRGRGHILRLELLGEGLLATYELPVMAMEPGLPRPILRCPCGESLDLVLVRRRYRGPVPRQVLAAFEFPPPTPSPEP